VTGKLEIVHIAIEQGEIAARNAARLIRCRGEKMEKIDYRLRLFAVFTQPEAAMVGLTESEAKNLGMDVAVAAHPFDDHGKSMVQGKIDGFVKLMADRATGELIGGSIVGPHASELIHEVVVALNYHATAGEFLRIPHYHPTLSEIWTYPAEELAAGG
jgi:pyruvate/2-oxoglutarate dehydrogenase complex dihydrolipoamide dehydrogenase (E3) component